MRVKSLEAPCMYSRWCGVVVGRGRFQLRGRSHHLTEAQSYEPLPHPIQLPNNPFGLKKLAKISSYKQKLLFFNAGKCTDKGGGRSKEGRRGKKKNVPPRALSPKGILLASNRIPD
ncbi:hypothetical protein TNCV_4248691 [Trichonephila clavipes]|nr:hypothetical protein TNCV_4248691 [Trichonephila clavipes]